MPQTKEKTDSNSLINIEFPNKELNVLQNEEKIKLLTHMIEIGISDEEIAKSLGLSRGGFRKRYLNLIKQHRPQDYHPAYNPKQSIDKDLLFELAKIQCSAQEICSIMQTSHTVLHQDEYEEVLERGRAEGKRSLRRALWQNALEKNHIAAQIWLSRQHLNMTDKQQIEVKGSVDLGQLSEDELLEKIQKIAEKQFLKKRMAAGTMNGMMTNATKGVRHYGDTGLGKVIEETGRKVDKKITDGDTLKPGNLT